MENWKGRLPPCTSVKVMLPNGTRQSGSVVSKEKPLMPLERRVMASSEVQPLAGSVTVKVYVPGRLTHGVEVCWPEMNGSPPTPCAGINVHVKSAFKGAIRLPCISISDPSQGRVRSLPAVACGGVVFSKIRIDSEEVQLLWLSVMDNV